MLKSSALAREDRKTQLREHVVRTNISWKQTRNIFMYCKLFIYWFVGFFFPFIFITIVLCCSSVLCTYSVYSSNKEFPWFYICIYYPHENRRHTVFQQFYQFFLSKKKKRKKRRKEKKGTEILKDKTKHQHCGQTSPGCVKALTVPHLAVSVSSGSAPQIWTRPSMAVSKRGSVGWKDSDWTTAFPTGNFSVNEP